MAACCAIAAPAPAIPPLPGVTGLPSVPTGLPKGLAILPEVPPCVAPGGGEAVEPATLTVPAVKGGN